MSNPLYRLERCRDLAEECRRLAASTLSGQLKKRYLLMAKDYTLLADMAEQTYLTERTIEDSKRCIESSRLLKVQLDQLQAFKNSD